LAVLGNRRRENSDAVMLCIGIVAMCVVIARAYLQSATIDESYSYLHYSALSWPSHWYPTLGNHVLNSIVVRVVTTIFGLTHLTLRSGALLGAFLYIASSYRICLVIVDWLAIRWPLFASLVINPFILDYLVASRGYSLALGFLMTAIAIVLIEMTSFEHKSSVSLYKRCSLVSIMVALSFSASFAFCYVGAAAVLLFMAWVLRKREGSWYGIVSACVIPGALVATMLVGSFLLNWPRGEPYFGATSVSELWHSLVSSCFFQLNGQVASPLILPALKIVGGFLPRAFYVSSILLFINGLIVVAKQRKIDPPVLMTGYFVAVVGLAFALAWSAHQVFGVLLPKERAGIYFVPLSTLAFGIAATLRPGLRVASFSRLLALVTLIASCLYFVGCLRLSYFKEWKFDAEAKTAFQALMTVKRTYGIQDVATGWEYVSTFQFYEQYYGGDATFNLLEVDSPPPPADRPAYVLNYPWNRDFIEKEKLKTIYHGEVSDVVVAIRGSAVGAQ
jgi:hypothetical protein